MDQQQQRRDRGTRTARSRWLIGVAAAMLLAACGGNGTGDEAVEEAPPVVLPAPPEVSVVVSGSGAAALEGVLVEVVGAAATATTAADGSARIVVADTRPVVLKLSKAGYTDTFKRATFGAGVTAARVRADLLPRADAQSLDASVGGRLQGRQGAVIDLPAGALVDAVTGVAVSGAVDIAMTPVDVGGDGIRAFPGLFSGIAADGQRKPIASYGTTEFALTQGGRRLNLAPGQTATIELPIFTPLHAPGVPVVVGDTIPLWSLDEATGVWKQEGSGTVVASTASPTGLAMRATVGHFSWWNCDIEIDAGRICVRIRVPDVADKDRVNVDDPKAVGDVDADPNLYRLGTARMVTIDGRTADDRFLRQAGIDFEAAFSDDIVCRAQQNASRGARAAGTGRPQPAGAVYDVTGNLAVPAGRTSSLTACAQVQRNGAQFGPEMACGTVFVAPAKDQTLATTIALVVSPAADIDFPQIVSQPAATSVEPGQAATFSVVASRAVNPDAPVSYQWTRNGVPIAGATASAFTTPATSLADNGGLYAVIVSAPAGTTLSYPARLAVVAPPPPPPPPNGATDRWVDAVSGNDGNAGSAAAPLKTISAAIAVVKAGGTVWLADGVWTKEIDPALTPQSQGLNCATPLRSPLATGTTIRAVHPGLATIRYASGAAICVGDTQVRDLRLEAETMVSDVAAITASGPGASLVSGTSFTGGIAVVATSGARVVLEPGGLSSYGDPGDLSGKAMVVLGAGSEVIVNGGRFDRLSSVPFNGSTPGPGCAPSASFYALSGGRLVLNGVDLAPGPARSASAKYDVAIGACSGARVELNGSTVSGFVRGDFSDTGLAITVANGSTLELSANSGLIGNKTGIRLANATATLDGGALVAGSLASGIVVSGSAPSTLTVRGGSRVTGGAGHGIDIRGSTATPSTLAIADATLSGNAGAGLYVQTGAVCRMRGTQLTGNGFGVQLHSSGACDLGTAASPGGNGFANVGSGVYASGSSSTAYTILAVGNTWAPGQQGADAQGRYSVPAGKAALDVGVLDAPGQNYRIDNLKATLRLAE